ncbi:uncharacterized protein LOC114410801 [Glycine soja]|uniref:uncharacterized protein LOC114410801 n=1 Tax=Glycine soja TaxID=3848 RepID=UPI00103CD83A|nr:uncharacterized protein LOC114410801 [Glycine soja]
MARTRGLGRALGHVTGRGVGRGDRDDSDDAPQRRRPIASARRQRVPVTAAHDEPVVPAPDVEVDVFLDDPMAPADVEDTGADIPTDTGAQAAEDEHEGFSGGPSDLSMLTQYANHVACSIWTGKKRPELKLSSHGRKVHSLGRSVPAIEGLVVGTGLSPLIVCSVDTGDWGLLSSFVERWHRETTNFHLPVGELTITLVSTEAARAETGQCRGPYCWIYEHFPSVAESTSDQDYNEDSPRICRWIATKKTVKSICTVAYKERLDRLWIPNVCWIPYREHRPVQNFHLISCYSGLLRWGPVAVYYQPERVVRQFGYTPAILAPPVDS